MEKEPEMLNRSFGLKLQELRKGQKIAKPDEKTLKMIKNSKDEYLKDLFSFYMK